MKKSFVCFLSAGVCIFCLTGKVNAQVAVSDGVRDDIILVTLNQMQDREEAIRDAMKEATLRGFSVKTNSPKSGAVRAAFRPLLSFEDFMQRLHPYVVNGITYSDNTYLTKNDRAGRVSYSDQAGAKMNFMGKGRSLSLDLGLSDERSPQGVLLKTSSQEASFLVEGNAPLGLYNLGFSDGVTTNYIGSDELGQKSDALQYKWTNSFSTVLGRNFNRLGFGLEYSRIDDKFANKFKRDSDAVVQAYSLNSYLRISKKTRIRWAYDYVTSQYTNHNALAQNSSAHNYSLGLSGVLTSKVTGSLGMRYGLSQEVSTSHGRTIAFTGKLAYAPSRRSDLALSVSHQMFESSDTADNALNDSIGFSGNHRLAFNPRLSVSFQTDLSFLRNPKTTLYTRDTTFTLGPGLSYAFRQWLDFSLAYNLTRFYSKTSEGYKENAVLFITQARF